MKFRVDWSIDQDNWIAVYKRWSSMSPQERANNIPAGGKLLGRWHDMSGRTGVAIVESDDLAAVHLWLWMTRNRLPLVGRSLLITTPDRSWGPSSLGDTWADTTTQHGRLMLTVLGDL